MNVKPSAPFTCFKCKLVNPCKNITQCFKFRLNKPIFERGIHFRLPKNEARKKPTHRKSVAKLLSALLSSLRQPKDMDQVMELKSFPQTEHPKAPFPLPLTPAYVKLGGAAKKSVSGQDDIEDACQSFENYLIDMIVEDGKVKDLMDVEELLYCWKNLKCPLYIDMVCRFYGELCKDLFANCSEDSSDTSNTIEQ